MEITVLILTVLFLAICIAWINHNVKKRNEEILRQNIELLKSVTSINRGTASERLLILTLLKSGIHPNAIFHDLYITKDDGKYVQIDLVVATKVGIIVFEIKDYSGWIYGKGTQTKWTQVLNYGREKYKFYNPIMQNNTHIKQLRKKLNENVPFYSVIVFYGNCRLEDVSFVPSGTFVTKGYRVLDVINTILQNNELANYLDKHHVIDVLKQAVKNGGKIETESQHIENIRDMLGTDRIFQ